MKPATTKELASELEKKAWDRARSRADAKSNPKEKDPHAIAAKARDLMLFSEKIDQPIGIVEAVYRVQQDS